MAVQDVGLRLAVTNPAAPVLVGGYETNNPASDVAVDDHCAYVLSGDLTVYSLTNDFTGDSYAWTLRRQSDNLSGLRLRVENLQFTVRRRSHPDATPARGRVH